MIWIISGPTSVGKSTFIASPRCAEITGLSTGAPVVWASSKRMTDQLGESDALLHYNILRPLQKMRRHGQLAEQPGGVIDGRLASFDQDPSWLEIRGHDGPKSAVVLVANKQTILKRIRRRSEIEAEELTGKTAKAYPNEKWESLLEQVDLPRLYAAWRLELRNHDIPYVLVESTSELFGVISDEVRLPDILGGAGRDAG